MFNINAVGGDWLLEETEQLTEVVTRLKPSEYNEGTRYLPESVTSIPGFIRYDVNPFMREIVDCFDIDSPVREVNIKKGVQITWSTLLESVALYYADHIGTLPLMYMTADKELATARIENNFIPMFNQSGLGHIIRSSDELNTRKTGKTKAHLQFEKGAYLVPFGALNANKMRSYSIAVMLKDEVDAWPDTVGKDGDPDKLSDDRCSGYWERRKIGRGSTPLLKANSKIQKAFERGDQRVYRVLCKSCGFPQPLRWSTPEGKPGGFKWDMVDGVLQLDSVRYCCQNCDAEHYEHDKERLFSPDDGAHWEPTAKPVQPGIRSYHLPALYSPVGMQPWYKSVASYLDGFDPVAKRVTDVAAYQVFYNNVLAEPFEVFGDKVRFTAVSLHRRREYKLGEIPNTFAAQHCGSPVLFLTATVDVHKNNLAVAVWGWCKDARTVLVDYWRFESEDCTELTAPAWGRLRELIEETIYTADDGKRYNVVLTLVDAGYSNDTVTTFCGDYAGGVFPILGRDRPAKNQTIKEFAEFETQQNTIGYRILVDHYKDRLAPVLRREWTPEAGTQKPYHLNAPVDTTDAQLKELTVETRREKKDGNGSTSYYWHRPGNAKNELWDLLGYGHASVEILATRVWAERYEGRGPFNWAEWWALCESETLFFTEGDG